jgi:hypothetical protein
MENAAPTVADKLSSQPMTDAKGDPIADPVGDPVGDPKAAAEDNPEGDGYDML